MRTILFVCTGNSCRSVMAAEMLKKILGHNDKIKVISAGVGAMLGMSATDNTIKVLQREGIDATKHKSISLSKKMIEEADLVLVMERYHKYRILEIAPDAKSKVYVLREFERDPQDVIEPDIPDPIGKPLEVYERSFDLIKEGIDNLIKWLKESGWI